MTIGFIVDVEFVWGHGSKFIGLSRSGISFYYPPLLTFLGAVSESIARECNISESKWKELTSELLKITKAVGFRPLNFVPLKTIVLVRL